MPKREIVGNYNLNNFYVVIDVKPYWWDFFLSNWVSYLDDWWRGFEKLVITKAPRGKVELWEETTIDTWLTILWQDKVFFNHVTSKEDSCTKALKKWLKIDQMHRLDRATM